MSDETPKLNVRYHFCLHDNLHGALIYSRLLRALKTDPNKLRVYRDEAMTNVLEGPAAMLYLQGLYDGVILGACCPDIIENEA